MIREGPLALSWFAPLKAMSEWVEAGRIGDVDLEDVIRFDHSGRSFAIYRSPESEFFATSAICTHEHAFLSDGLVLGDVIECPKHNGRFNYKTGAARGAPACVNLRTFPVEIVDGRVMIKID